MSARVLVSGSVLGQPPSGVTRHNAELLPRLAALLEARGGGLSVLEGREPIAFALPPSIERIQSQVPARPAWMRSLSEARALERELARAAAQGRPYDLVHTAHLPVPRSLRAPFTLTLHDLRSLEFEHTPFSRRFVARSVIGSAVERARVVITVSHSVRRSLIERFTLEENKVCVVPNAADHFEVMQRQPGPDAPILCVGHVERRKNLELVLRALARSSDLPRVHFAGRPRGGERERLERLAAELGVSERVRFSGGFEDSQLPRLYAEAACVLIPSRLEGFGIGVLEAQRARVPLAVSRSGALPEVAGEGTPSFEWDDVEGCARSVFTALQESTDELEQAAERADRYRWDRSASAWLEAIDRALAAQPSSTS